MEIKVENSGEFAYLMEEFANIIKNSEKNSENSHNLTFGQAIEALKNGKRVSRKGWNGKGMFLYLIKGGEIASALKYGFGEYENEPTITDSIAMKTAQNTIVVGWLASQTDILAEDWEIIE